MNEWMNEWMNKWMNEWKFISLKHKKVTFINEKTVTCIKNEHVSEWVRRYIMLNYALFECLWALV